MSTAPKLLGSTRLKLQLAVVCVAILAVGAILRPRSRETALAAPAERAAPLFQEQAAARESAASAWPIDAITSRVDTTTVAIVSPTTSPGVAADYGPRRSPQIPWGGFGVVAATDGAILSHEAALSGRSTVEIVVEHMEEAREATLAAYEPATGLVLLRAPIGGSFTVPDFGSGLSAGAVAVAIGRSATTVRVTPVFITRVIEGGYEIGAPGAPLLPGTPIYTTAGELIAVAGDGPMAFAAQTAIERLLMFERAGVARPGSLGLMLQPLDSKLASVFGAAGVVICDVVPDGPAAAAELLSGDLLLRVGDTPVSSIDDAQRRIAALPLHTPTTVTVRRNGSDRAVVIAPAAAFDIAAMLRGRPARIAGEQPSAREIFDLPELKASGIEADDRVLAVNQRPVTSRAEAMHELTRAPRVVLGYFDRHGTRFFAVVEPAR